MRPASRLSPRPLVVTALLAAILLLAQISLSFLPNIELVTLLLLCYTAVFPLRQVLGAVLVFDLLEGILYGFGLWWVMYLYVWPIWVILSLALRRTSSGLVRAVAAGGYGLCFGALCALPYLAFGPGAALANWVSGIPFDIAHCAGNFLTTLLLYTPLVKGLSLLQRQGEGTAVNGDKQP